MKFKVVKKDEEVVKGGLFRFTIVEETEKDTIEYNYFIDNQGFTYQKIDDEHSIALGLRTFINAPAEFQQLMIDCYLEFRDKLKNLSVIDK